MGELQRRIKEIYDLEIERAKEIAKEENATYFAPRPNNILAIVGLMIKEFPIRKLGTKGDWEITNSMEVEEWFVRWLMPVAQKSKDEEKEEVNK